MKTLNNPCSECITTTKHCCVTDIVLSMADAMLMMRKAKELNKDVVLGVHPQNGEGFNSFMMVPNKPGIDVTIEPCVFFGSDGKCEIYEDRPSICRIYGTEDVRCRYEYAGMTDAASIASVDKAQMRKLDENALDKSFNILGKIVNFIGD